MKKLRSKLSIIFRYLFLMSISIFGLIAIIATGGGGGGGNDDIRTSIKMTEYFPLSSGWVTDEWTLSIDILDHDVNGVLTKAMVDTQKFPSAYYWTNDINGLRLHKIKRYDPMQGPFEVQLSAPIKLADAECPVGSIQEGTITACENGSCWDGFYSCKFVGFEDITTPAGNFSNCAKFKTKMYSVGESPDDIGYETFWLGKNVGFVKARSDINADGIFTREGETRQLISYHLTPSGMTQDEIDVRNAYKQIESYSRQKDLANLMAMIDDNYLDSSCRTKPLFENDVFDFWTNSTENWDFVSIEEVLFDGPDYAYVIREWTNSYKSIPDQFYESLWSSFRHLFKKQADGSWKLYGNQNQIYPWWLDVYVRRTPSGTALAIGAYFRNCATGDNIDSPNDIPLLTITGPPGSSLIGYTPPWEPTDKGFWGEVDISKAAKGYYTFEWTDKHGSSLLASDYLSTTSELPIPVLISPINFEALNSGTVDFQWGSVAGANEYRVEVFDVATGDRIINERTNINAYTNPVPLPAGKSYQWRARALYYDEYGDVDSESRSGRENFSIN